MKRLFAALVLVLHMGMTPALAAKSASAGTPGPEEGIPTGRYIAGGIVGTAAGLGIGHAIQARYVPLGLVFTIGEAIGYTAFFADTTFSTTSSGSFTRTTSMSMGTLAVMGLVLVAGLHVWEVIDVWVTGAELHRKWEATHKQASLSVLPVVGAAGESGPGLTVGWRF